MSDVLKFVTNQQALESDPQGRLMDLPAWNEAIASQLAAQMDIELNEDHWYAVRQLREHYLSQGRQTARKLGAFLEELFADKGGRRYLYQLFPNGPVTQASQLAGLPLPEGSKDPGFGIAR